jgi:hypothetical protein
VDPSAPSSMKNAASCDTCCELQKPVDHRTFERILRSLVYLGACPFEYRYICNNRLLLWKASFTG